jgi:hypothetical protein
LDQGKTVFITEYPPFIMKHNIMLSALQSHETVVSKLNNPTCIPDELLKLFTPIIFIQHPALTIPAWLRLAKAEYGSHATIDDDDFTVWTSLRWSRMLFDYLRDSQHLRRKDSVQTPKRQDSIGSPKRPSSAKYQPGYVATKPYVIDAADVATNTHAMLAAVCRLLGIEYSEASATWGKYFSKAATAFKSAVPQGIAHAFSSRLQNEGPVVINIEQEASLWEREFGPETAKLLRKKVDEEMPHFKYLQNFKVRILPSLTTGTTAQTLTGMPDRRMSAITPTVEDLQRDSFDTHPLRIVKSAIEYSAGRQSEPAVPSRR